jgi:hypothetical protein
VTPDQTAIPLQTKGQRGASDLVRLGFVCDRAPVFFWQGLLRLREAMRQRMSHHAQHEMPEKMTLFLSHQLLKSTFHRFSAVKLSCYIPLRDFLGHNSCGSLHRIHG